VPVPESERDRRAVSRVQLLTPASAPRTPLPSGRYDPLVGLWPGLLRPDKRGVRADSPVDGFDRGLVGHRVLT
jgi:hypothetical protein